MDAVSMMNSMVSESEYSNQKLGETSYTPTHAVPGLEVNPDESMASLPRLIVSAIGRLYLSERLPASAEPSLVKALESGANAADLLKDGPSRRCLETALECLCADPSACTELARYICYANSAIKITSVKEFRVLGSGAFGQVYGFSLTEIGKLLACKKMGRKKVEGLGMSQFIRAEHEALKRCAETSHPCCMKLLYAYTFADTYHFVMPLASSGDLEVSQTRAIGGGAANRADFYCCVPTVSSQESRRIWQRESAGVRC